MRFDDQKARLPGRLDSRMRPYPKRQMMEYSNRHRLPQFDSPAGPYGPGMQLIPPESSWRR